VVVIVVRRYAGLVVFAGAGLRSFLCGDVGNWPLLAIIERHGFMFLPLKKRYYAIFFGLKISNLFWQPLPV
jgi:hypothetical protein